MMSSPKPGKHDTKNSHIPRLTDDPSPPDSDASWDENVAYIKALDAYSSEKLIAFEQEENIRGKEMWTRFKRTFCKDAINSLSRDSLLTWRSLLLSRGVYVMRGLNDNASLVEALVECLRESDFVPLATGQGSSQEETGVRKYSFESSPIVTETFQPLMEDDFASAANEKPLLGRTKALYHDDTADSSRTSSDPNGPSVEPGNSLGMSGLITFYSNRPRYSGDPLEDLYGIVEVYKSLCSLCGLTGNEMVRALPLILEGDALMFFCRRLKEMRGLDQVVEALWEEFIPESLRIDLLIIWQKTSLTKHLRKNPQKSELQVFRDVCRFLEATQKKLDKVYHSDIFLRDQILFATDIPELQVTLSYPVSESSRAAKKRIEKFLSCAPGSARRS